MAIAGALLLLIVIVLLALLVFHRCQSTGRRRQAVKQHRRGRSYYPRIQSVTVPPAEPTLPAN